MGMTDVKRDGIHEESGGVGKRIELANTYFFKGRKSLTKGNKEEALRMFRASIAIQEEVYGTYDRRTARSYFFLAQTLFKHTNEFDRALTAYRRAFRVGLSLDGDHKYVQGAKRAIRELLHDEKAFDTSRVEGFFSSVVESVQFEKEGREYSANKNFERALESFEKCFAIEEKAEGTFPLDLGHLYIRIAEVHGKQGDHGMAISAYRSALSIYESALGREYADSIFCLRGIESSLHEMNLSNTAIQEYSESIFTSLHHCEKGDSFIKSSMFKEAVNEYEAARLIEEKSLGNYPLTASYIRRKLGLAFRSLNEYDRAILELRTALSINIFECGDDHKSVVATLQDIRSVMGEKGYDFPSVNKYMNTVVFSVKHERYGEHLLLEKKDFSGAIEEFQKSLGLEVSALGKFHLTQGGLFKAIGDTFLQNESFDFAIVNYRNALVVYQHILGIKHDYTISVLSSIGDATRRIGLNTDQVEEYKKVVSESITVEKMAENLIKDGLEIDAIAAYRRAVRRESSLLGVYHLSTADLHGKIAKVLKNMGRYDSAIVSYRCILAINLKSLGMVHMNTENAYEDLVDTAILKGLKKEDAVSYGQNAKLSIEHEDDGDEAMVKKNFRSAINNYKKALEKEERFLGENHLVIEGIIRKIVKCHKLSAKTGQAFHFYRKMIRIYMTYASPDYDTNYMLQSLEATVQDLGLSEAQKVEYIDIVKESVKCEINGDSADESKDYSKAIDSYSRCLLMEQSLLGMLHPSTWSVHKKIGSTFEKNGDIDSAIVSHSKALAILESYLGLKEKETLESCNDLLNATLHKIDRISDKRQVGSTQNNKFTTSSEESFEKSMLIRNEYKERAQKKEKNEVDDIYSVFASLRNGISREVDSREGDKMEILKGLAQKWHDLDERGTRIGINAHLTNKNISTKAEGVDSALGQKLEARTPKDMKPGFLSKKKRETDMAKESAGASDSSKVSKSRQGKDSKLKSAIISFSKKTSSGTKNKGIGSIFQRFSNREKGGRIEPGEAAQRKIAPTKLNDSQRKTTPLSQQKPTTSQRSNSQPKNTTLQRRNSQQNTTPTSKRSDSQPKSTSLQRNESQPRNTTSQSSDSKQKITPLQGSDLQQKPTPTTSSTTTKNVKEDISYVPAKSSGTEYLSMHIPEIPAFKGNLNSKRDIGIDLGLSMSSNSSMSSYESYESL